MRSGAIRFGELLIFIGVLVLSVQYVNWSALPMDQLADLVIAGGIILLVCFGLALGSRSLLSDEFVHLIVLLVVAGVIGLIISGSGAASWASISGPVRAEATLPFEGSFAADAAAPSVELQLINGRATVQTWERDTYQLIIHARAHGWSRSDAQRALEDAMLRPQTSPSEIAFATPHAPWTAVQVETDVQLFLPRGRTYALNLTTVNGELRIEELHATEAHLKTVNGQIQLGTLTAERMTLETLNGRISGELAASEAMASTTNGAIELTLDAMAGTYDLSTLNGRVRLTMPKDPQVGVSMVAESALGSVGVELTDFAFTRQERRHIEGATSNFLNAQTKITLRVHTTNGSIEITR
jgi:DUF4097 and DUF4098 domain-containing protein YvlB